MTINPDDGAMWGASGVTYDWFQFFLVSGNSTGLGMLKQLAINSIMLSSLKLAEKQATMLAWSTKWEAYVLWLSRQKPIGPALY